MPKGIKVSVEKMLERVQQVAAEDAEKYAEAFDKYTDALGEWCYQCELKLLDLVEELAAAQMDGEIGGMEAVAARVMNVRRGYGSHEAVAFQPAPVRPSKPDHTAAIRELELTADDTITIDAGTGFGCYLRG